MRPTSARWPSWREPTPAGPEDLADCLAVAALRATRYHEEAEAALLDLSPERLDALEQEAIRRGLGYDDLAAQVLIERIRLTNYTVDAPSGGAEFSIP
jgi:hypothetical protein